MSNKVIKPVSFNITKLDDVKMLEHVKRRNFSGYIKRLIWQDLKANEVAKNEILKSAETLTAAQRIEQAKNQITTMNQVKSQQ